MRKRKNKKKVSRKLAHCISYVMKHPKTPVAIWNCLADELCDMTKFVDLYTPEMVAKLLTSQKKGKCPHHAEFTKRNRDSVSS